MTKRRSLSDIVSTVSNRSWWIDVGWQLQGYLPEAAEKRLRRCYSHVLPFTGLRIPVGLLRGPTRPSGREGTLLYAGQEPWIEYFPGRFFARTPQKEEMGKVWIWELPRTLRRLQPSADLTIARIDRISATRLFGTDCLSVPEWVGLSLQVPQDLEKFVRASTNLKEDMRVVRRNGLRPIIGHSEGDFDLFYRTMYVPFTYNRFGGLAAVANRHRLFHRFRHGGILWVERSGQRLAGNLFSRRGQTLYAVALGTANGELAPIEQGAFAAAYYYLIAYARQHGCTRIDFGPTRASLHDGGLQYKRKWGSRLGEEFGCSYDHVVFWSRLDGVVADFLSHTATVFRDRGGLSAVSVLNRAESATLSDVRTVHRSIWIPGLHRLYLVATNGWQSEIDAPPQTCLIDPRALGDGGPRALLAASN
jgi:hypothetical protein